MPARTHEYESRDDGLAVCCVCGGAEGALTTDCPGERMGISRADKVYAGELDFRGGRWVRAHLTPEEVAALCDNPHAVALAAQWRAQHGADLRAHGYSSAYSDARSRVLLARAAEMDAEDKAQ